jgi:hypothetical protein
MPLPGVCMRPMVGVLAVFYDAKDHSMTSRTFARARTDRARSRASERRRRRRRSTSRPHREVFFSEGLFTDHDSSIVPFFRVCLTTTHGSRSVEGLARSRSRVTTQKRVPHHRAPLASPGVVPVRRHDATRAGRRRCFDERSRRRRASRDERCARDRSSERCGDERRRRDEARRGGSRRSKRANGDARARRWWWTRARERRANERANE